MKIKNKKDKIINNKIKILLIILGIWWAISFLLAAFQAYSMFYLWYAFPIGIILASIAFYAHYFLSKKLIQRNKTAIIIFYIYAAIHFIPLALQLLGVKMPGFDNVVMALIGLAMVYLYKN